MDPALTDLPCSQLVELTTDLLEDALDDELRTRVELHLVVCAGCEAYVDQMRRTVEALGRLGAEPPEPAQREALLAAFRALRTPGGEDVP